MLKSAESRGKAVRGDWFLEGASAKEFNIEVGGEGGKRQAVCIKSKHHEFII